MKRNGYPLPHRYSASQRNFIARSSAEIKSEQRRGPETLQLGINYRGSSLAREENNSLGERSCGRSRSRRALL
jgi:hypothetical protein